jgi:hypothetical protein
MEIKSPAGEFSFDIESLEIENDDIVLVGKMGVWEARTHMSGDDLIKFLRLTVGNLLFWRFLLKLPAHALRSKRDKGAST